MGNTIERLRHNQTTGLSRQQPVANKMGAVRTVADYNEIDVEGHGLTFDLEASLTPVCVLTLQPFPLLLGLLRGVAAVFCVRIPRRPSARRLRVWNRYLSRCIRPTYG